MYRTIAAVMVAASIASAAGAQTTTPPGIPAATTSSQSTDAFSLENALAAGGMPSIPSAVLDNGAARSEEHTSELQSLMRISYAVFCLKKKKKRIINTTKTLQRNSCYQQTQSYDNPI